MIDYKAALAHFKLNDPVMVGLAESALKSRQGITIIKTKPPETYFESLVSSIVSQQLSIKAADTIWNRFQVLVGKIEPQSVLKKRHQDLRSAGLSNTKASYVLALAQDVLDKKVDLAILNDLENEAVIEELVKFKGIGRWSAEMFLMFTLARPDLFSVGDLGLVRSVEQAYDRPGITPAELEQLSQAWSPHRTAAALTLWSVRDS